MVTDSKKDKLSNKSRGDSQIKVEWQHTEEVTPAMRRLLMLLLRPRGNHPVDTVRTDEERQDGQ